MEGKETKEKGEGVGVGYERPREIESKKEGGGEGMEREGRREKRERKGEEVRGWREIMEGRDRMSKG